MTQITEHYSYADAIRQLQDYGHISLLHLQSLSYADVECLFEEINRWLIYGRDINFIHDPKKLRTERRRSL
jgi:hypothetical protein